LKKIASMAEACCVGFCPHNPYGPVNSMAALHVDATAPNFVTQEGGHGEWYDSILLEPFPYAREDYFELPEGVGLGIELNEEVLRAHPFNPVEQSTGYRSRMTLPSRQENHWI